MPEEVDDGQSGCLSSFTLPVGVVVSMSRDAGHAVDDATSASSIFSSSSLSSPHTSRSNDDHNAIPIGAYAGGGAAFLLIVALGLFLCRRRRQRRASVISSDFEIDPSLKSPVVSLSDAGEHSLGALRRVATYMLQTSRVWSVRSRSVSVHSPVPVQSHVDTGEQGGPEWWKMSWRSPSTSTPSRRSITSYIFPSPVEGPSSWQNRTSWTRSANSPRSTAHHYPPTVFFPPEMEKSFLLLNDSSANVNGIAPSHEEKAEKVLVRPALAIQTPGVQKSTTSMRPDGASVSYTAVRHPTSPLIPLPQPTQSPTIRKLPPSPPFPSPTQTPIIATARHAEGAFTSRPLPTPSSPTLAANTTQPNVPAVLSSQEPWMSQIVNVTCIDGPARSGATDDFGLVAGAARKNRLSLSARPMGPRQATTRSCASVPRQVQSVHAGTGRPSPLIIPPDKTSRRNTFGVLSNL